MFGHLSRKAFTFAVSKKQKNLYDVLKISRTASPEDVKASYYKLAKEFHPDTHQGQSSVAETFKEINQAYNVLRDPAKRKQYDEQNFTVDGQKKQYKFYDTKHNYGYNAKTYRKNPYHTTNPFESTFSGQSSHQANTNPYNSDFSNYYKPSSSEPQTWDEYVKNEHRKNVYQNRKTAMNRMKRSNSIMYIVLGIISVYIVGQLTFKIYEFNNFYKNKSYAQKLDPNQLINYQPQYQQYPQYAQYQNQPRMGYRKDNY